MAKILVTCRTCRHAKVRTEGNSYTVEGHNPFLCDCQAHAAVDRYGNEIRMFLNTPHPCRGYEAKDGCVDEMAEGQEMIALAEAVSPYWRRKKR